jgi:hypothetical protein
MNPRTTSIVVATLLSAIAVLAIGANYHNASLPKIDLAIFELLTSVGLLMMLFAIFPSGYGSAAATFDRAADFSRVSLEIRVARPVLMRCGMVAFGIGLMGAGLMGVFGALP